MKKKGDNHEKNRIIPIVAIVILIAILGGVVLHSFLLNHKKINSKVEFVNLLGMDFTNVKITDIQYQKYKDKDVGEYTLISVFLEESDESLQSREYYIQRDGTGGTDTDTKNIPPGHIEEIKKLGIDTGDIKKFGWNFKDFKVWWGQIRPYEIHWYELSETHNRKGNILILTSIPYKIELNVERIMQEQ